MDFLTLEQNRFSVRSYKTDPVPEEMIGKIVEAGRKAPTAHNAQPQKITVVTGADGLAKLKNCTKCHYNAPLAFIVCHDRDVCWTREYDGKKSGDVDASIVTTYMMLEAASLGLGSVWVMYFDPAALRREFDIPANLEPTAILIAGYAADDAHPSPSHGNKRGISEIVSYR